MKGRCRAIYRGKSGQARAEMLVVIVRDPKSHGRKNIPDGGEMDSSQPEVT